jgi:hypothetical protein
MSAFSQNKYLVAAALASIPFGLSGSWLWSMHAMQKQQMEDFKRRVRVVVQSRLERGDSVEQLTAESVLRDLAAIERARVLEKK